MDEVTHGLASFLYSVSAPNTVLSICLTPNTVSAAEDVQVNNTHRDSRP